MSNKADVLNLIRKKVAYYTPVIVLLMTFAYSFGLGVQIESILFYLASLTCILGIHIVAGMPIIKKLNSSFIHTALDEHCSLIKINSINSANTLNMVGAGIIIVLYSFVQVFAPILHTKGTLEYMLFFVLLLVLTINYIHFTFKFECLGNIKGNTVLIYGVYMVFVSLISELSYLMGFLINPSLNLFSLSNSNNQSQCKKLQSGKKKSFKCSVIKNGEVVAVF